MDILAPPPLGQPMLPSVFTRIIAGEIPADFVWKDDAAVAFMDIEPQTRGHAVVVPRVQIDQWTDLPENLLSHLTAVAQHISKAQLLAFSPKRIALIVEGFEVPHVHLHVFPAYSPQDFDLTRKQGATAPERAADAAAIIAALKKLGFNSGKFGHPVPDDAGSASE